MGTPKVARKAPKKPLLYLEDVRVQQVKDFSGKPILRQNQDKMPVTDVALAIDFLERIQWRRVEEEKKAWIDSETVSDRLHTLRRLMAASRALQEADKLNPVQEHELTDLMNDVFEYLTIRAELAGETCIPRRERYMVTLEEGALARASARTIARKAAVA